MIFLYVPTYDILQYRLSVGYSNGKCPLECKKNVLLKIQLNNYMKCYDIDKIRVPPVLLKSNQNQILEVKFQLKF